METRSASLTQLLELLPHPEGRHYREIFRSDTAVQPLDDRGQRPALTTIFFLLTAGETIRWHPVGSNEVWHEYEGEPLELFTADPEFGEIARTPLGPVTETQGPALIATAGSWQGACSTGPYTLVGCTVGPGCDFSDIDLLSDLPMSAAGLRRRHPVLTQLP
jgi:uncharacterized protein